MKLVVHKKRENGMLISNFELTEISEEDKTMLSGLDGLLNLNIGGNVVKKEMIDDGSGGTIEKETVLLKQGDKFVKFPSFLPFQKTWSIARYGKDKAREIAQLETDAIANRIVEIAEEMKANPDDFSGIDEIILTP